MIRFTNAEMQVMNVIWRDGDCSAKHIADVMAKEASWHINTTYTIIHKCMEKGMISRSEKGFICHANIEKGEAQESMIDDLTDKLFDGSRNGLFAALLGKKSLSDEQIEKLRAVVREEGEKGDGDPA